MKARESGPVVSSRGSSGSRGSRGSMLIDQAVEPEGGSS